MDRRGEHCSCSSGASSYSSDVDRQEEKSPKTGILEHAARVHALEWACETCTCVNKNVPLCVACGTRRVTERGSDEGKVQQQKIPEKLRASEELSPANSQPAFTSEKYAKIAGDQRAPLNALKRAAEYDNESTPTNRGVSIFTLVGTPLLQLAHKGAEPVPTSEELINISAEPTTTKDASNPGVLIEPVAVAGLSGRTDRNSNSDSRASSKSDGSHTPSDGSGEGIQNHWHSLLRRRHTANRRAVSRQQQKHPEQSQSSHSPPPPPQQHTQQQQQQQQQQ
jgi:hypothetical protein